MARSEPEKAIGGGDGQGGWLLLQSLRWAMRKSVKPSNRLRKLFVGVKEAAIGVSPEHPFGSSAAAAAVVVVVAAAGDWCACFSGTMADQGRLL